MREVLSRPVFKTSTFGVLVAHVKTGNIIFEYGADKLLAPASNTKLVSAAGALAALGKDFRFETIVVATGPVKDGVLEGDLVLVAGGDPNLSGRIAGDRLLFEDKDHSYAGFYDASLVPGDPLKVVKDLALQVTRAGIARVRGDVVVDDGLFAETQDDFVGPVSAACVNDNLIDVTVHPGARPGDPARIEFQPQGSSVHVTSTAVTGATGAETDLWLEPGDGVASFTAGGVIAADSNPVLRTASFRNPALAAAGFLADALAARKVEVSGKPRQARHGPAKYGAHTVVARHRSPPFAECLRVILKVSQNLHATMLPVAVGALKGERADRRAGYRVIHDLFAARGLDMDAVLLQSGSGGGRADALSARWLVALLREMAARADFPVFLEALPLGGADGTLASAFTDEVFANRVRAKTGTLVYRGALNDNWIYLSKSLSGYLDLRSKERPDDLLAFSIIIANTLARTRRKGSEDLFQAQEDILRAVIGSWGAAARP
jgi:D-alanyl-D-alanine carboxypeptidase/D-alanyl-D-alanine-endopeptidase (penicillin-binding protein 4)